MWIINTLFILLIIIYSNLPFISTMGIHINKLIFIHVPTAWLISLIYLLLTLFAITFIIRKDPRIIRLIISLINLGLITNLITLITGSIWAKQTWGSYWIWEGRLTTVLVLFIFQLLIFTLLRSHKYLESSILILFGCINIPLIKFSVDWWTGLHQGATISSMDITTEILLILITLIFVIIGARILWVNYKTHTLNLINQYSGIMA